MKKTTLPLIKKAVATTASLVLLANAAQAQILFSSGSPYSQNFDGFNTGGTWTDNSTLAGWYAARGGGSGTMGPITAFTAGTGSSGTGAFYSFGVAGVNPVTDRAMGSVCSGTTGTQAYGVRFTNDTSLTITNIIISYTGEQWRNGGNTASQPLSFSYFKSGAAITSPDPSNTVVWTSVSALTFNTPINTSTAAALDGNDPANRTALSATLTGFTVGPGEEVFFRWVDINDSGNDHGVALDDLSISWSTVAPNLNPPSISQQPIGVTNYAGNNVTFSVTATGKAPLSYQWYYTNSGSTVLLSGATAASLALTTITNANAGQYYVVVTNDVPGVVTSSIVNLKVLSAVVTNIAYLHTLQDSVNYALTDTNTLYQITGIVTTPNLVVGSPAYSFYIQDATGGIDVFERGGFAALGQINSDLPSVGQIVTITAPLAQFNGAIEVSPVAANPAHSLVLSNNDTTIYPLPAAVTFDLATLSNISMMETNYEGLRVKVLNVNLSGAGGTFPAEGFSTNITMTNISLLTMPIFVPAPANDLHGTTVPAFAYSVTGVITQNKSSAPFTGSYSLDLTSLADLDTVGSSTPVLNLSTSGTTLTLTWNGTYNLQSATNVAGPYTTISGATSGFQTNAALSIVPAQFFRLSN